LPKPIIDYKKCTTCGSCVDICPVNVFAKEKKVVVKNPDDCISCRACEAQCSENAIKVED